MIYRRISNTEAINCQLAKLVISFQACRFALNDFSDGDPTSEFVRICDAQHPLQNVANVDTPRLDATGRLSGVAIASENSAEQTVMNDRPLMR